LKGQVFFSSFVAGSSDSPAEKILTSGIIRRSINEVSRDLALVTLSHIFNAIRLQCEPKRLYEFLFLTYAHSHESHISLHALLP